MSQTSNSKGVGGIEQGANQHYIYFDLDVYAPYDNEVIYNYQSNAFEYDFESIDTLNENEFEEGAVSFHLDGIISQNFWTHENILEWTRKIIVDDVEFDYWDDVPGNPFPEAALSIEWLDDMGDGNSGFRFDLEYNDLDEIKNVIDENTEDGFPPRLPYKLQLFVDSGFNQVKYGALLLTPPYREDFDILLVKSNNIKQKGDARVAAKTQTDAKRINTLISNCKSTGWVDATGEEIDASQKEEGHHGQALIDVVQKRTMDTFHNLIIYYLSDDNLTSFGYTKPAVGKGAGSIPDEVLTISEAAQPFYENLQTPFITNGLVATLSGGDNPDQKNDNAEYIKQLDGGKATDYMQYGLFQSEDYNRQINKIYAYYYREVNPSVTWFLKDQKDSANQKKYYDRANGKIAKQTAIWKNHILMANSAFKDYHKRLESLAVLATDNASYPLNADGDPIYDDIIERFQDIDRMANSAINNKMYWAFFMAFHLSGPDSSDRIAVAASLGDTNAWAHSFKQQNLLLSILSTQNDGEVDLSFTKEMVEAMTLQGQLHQVASNLDYLNVYKDISEEAYEVLQAFTHRYATSENEQMANFATKLNQQMKIDNNFANSKSMLRAFNLGAKVDGPLSSLWSLTEKLYKDANGEWNSKTQRWAYNSGKFMLESLGIGLNSVLMVFGVMNFISSGTNTDKTQKDKKLHTANFVVKGVGLTGAVVSLGEKYGVKAISALKMAGAGSKGFFLRTYRRLLPELMHNPLQRMSSTGLRMLGRGIGGWARREMFGSAKTKLRAIENGTPPPGRLTEMKDSVSKYWKRHGKTTKLGVSTLFGAAELAMSIWQLVDDLKEKHINNIKVAADSLFVVGGALTVVAGLAELAAAGAPILASAIIAESVGGAIGVGAATAAISAAGATLAVSSALSAFAAVAGPLIAITGIILVVILTFFVKPKNRIQLFIEDYASKEGFAYAKGRHYSIFDYNANDHSKAGIQVNIAGVSKTDGKYGPDNHLIKLTTEGVSLSTSDEDKYIDPTCFWIETDIHYDVANNTNAVKIYAQDAVTEEVSVLRFDGHQLTSQSFDTNTDKNHDVHEQYWIARPIVDDDELVNTKGIFSFENKHYPGHYLVRWGDKIEIKQSDNTDDITVFGWALSEADLMPLFDYPDFGVITFSNGNSHPGVPTVIRGHNLSWKLETQEKGKSLFEIDPDRGTIMLTDPNTYLSKVGEDAPAPRVKVMGKVTASSKMHPALNFPQNVTVQFLSRYLPDVELVSQSSDTLLRNQLYLLDSKDNGPFLKLNIKYQGAFRDSISAQEADGLTPTITPLSPLPNFLSLTGTGDAIQLAQTDIIPTDFTSRDLILNVENDYGRQILHIALGRYHQISLSDGGPLLLNADASKNQNTTPTVTPAVSSQLTQKWSLHLLTDGAGNDITDSPLPPYLIIDEKTGAINVNTTSLGNKNAFNAMPTYSARVTLEIYDQNDDPVGQFSRVLLLASEGKKTAYIEKLKEKYKDDDDYPVEDIEAFVYGFKHGRRDTDTPTYKSTDQDRVYSLDTVSPKVHVLNKIGLPVFLTIDNSGTLSTVKENWDAFEAKAYPVTIFFSPADDTTVLMSYSFTIKCIAG